MFPQPETGLGDIVQSFFLSPARSTASGITWGAGPVPIQVGVNQLISGAGQLGQIGGLVRYGAENAEGGPDWGFQLRMTLVFPRVRR